jgi:hypothetical protein
MAVISCPLFSASVKMNPPTYPVAPINANFISILPSIDRFKISE